MAAVALVMGAVVWFRWLSPLAASETPVEGCSGGVCTSTGDGLSVVPDGGGAGTGLILYTGARVPPAAYAPVARRIALAGYPVFIPALTLNYAIFDGSAADAVISAHPEIGRWVIAGHSLGGVMAARYAASNDGIGGLAFWGSYPEQSLDLSASDLRVVSVYGSADGLSRSETVLASRARLPETARFVEIVGGNHGQFGDYGPQRGDNPAGVTSDKQWDQVASATVALLDDVSWDLHLGDPKGCLDVFLYWTNDEGTRAVVVQYASPIERNTGTEYTESGPVSSSRTNITYLEGTDVTGDLCTVEPAPDHKVMRYALANGGTVSLTLDGNLDQELGPDSRIHAEAAIDDVGFDGVPYPVSLSGAAEVGWSPR
jgi:dienelactone hydrolase